MKVKFSHMQGEVTEEKSASPRTKELGTARQGENMSRVREVGRQTCILITPYQDCVWLKKIGNSTCRGL